MISHIHYLIFQGSDMALNSSAVEITHSYKFCCKFDLVLRRVLSSPLLWSLCSSQTVSSFSPWASLASSQPTHGNLHELWRFPASRTTSLPNLCSNLIRQSSAWEISISSRLRSSPQRATRSLALSSRAISNNG